MFRHHERSKRLRRLTACLMAVFLAFAGSSFGQERVEKGSSLAAKIERARMVRVRTPQGELTLLRPVILVEGVASRIRADGEELKNGHNEATLISWKDVHQIRMRKSAALIGALSGLGLGGAMGFTLVRTLSEGDANVGQYFTGTALIAVPACLLGTMIGLVFTHWKSVYVAPSGSRPSVQVSLTPTRRGGAAFSLALSF